MLSTMKNIAANFEFLSVVLEKNIKIVKLKKMRLLWTKILGKRKKAK